MILNNKYLKITFFILLVVMIIFYLSNLGFILNIILNLFTIIVLPFLFASFFYYLLRPVVKFLTKKKINKTFAVISVILLNVILLVVLFIFAGSTIAKEFNNFSEIISKYVNEISKSENNIFDQKDLWIFSLEDIENGILNISKMLFESINENIFTWFTNITEVITIIIIIPIIVFFLLKDDELFYDNINNIIPEKMKKKITGIMKEIDNILQSYYIGQLVVAAFLGLITFIGYLIIGLPNALFLAIFSMIFSLIPFLGPLIGVIPAIFIGWTVNPLMILKVIIVLIITQQLEGNIVRPKVMGDRLKIHPLIIIILVITAVTLTGFIGAFFVIPLYAIARIIVRNYVKLTNS